MGYYNTHPHPQVVWSSHQGDADMSADFRLKETASGAACFESITCPGMCISIRSTSTQIQGCHFSISRLVHILPDHLYVTGLL